MKQITYTEAFEELQNIVMKMEEGEIGIDELSEKVKRASELIGICKKKLHHAEEDVKNILKDLEEPGDEPA